MPSRIICRGTGLMAGSPGGTGKARPRDRADALARAEDDAASRRAAAHRGEDQRAMGHVGIVAGVLDHPGRRRAVRLRGGGKREGGVAAPGQGHLDRIGKRAGQQRRVRRLGGRRSAGAGGPAAAERSRVVAAMPPAIERRAARVTAGARAMTARGLIVAAPRSGAGKTTRDARPARGAADGAGSRSTPPRPGPTISIPPFTRPRPGGRASISTAGR